MPDPNELLLPAAQEPPMNVVDEPLPAEFNPEPDEALKRQVKAQIKDFLLRFNQGRKFDEAGRKQFITDRNYASGRALLQWSVSTNIIASNIDVLVATLYARDPDVSVRKAPHVDEEQTQDMEVFARTLELIISRLWKSAKLKKRMRKVIRSVLSVGQGWLKVVPIGQMKPDPLIKTQLNSLEDNVRRVQELRRQMAAGQTPEGNTASDEELALQEANLQQSMAALQSNVERMVYEGLAIDVVKPDDIQVSTDVETLEDYEEANVIWHVLYYRKDELLEKFPELVPADAPEGFDALAGVTCYYRKAPRVTNNAYGNTETSVVGAMDQAMYPDQSAQDAYSLAGGADEGPAYARIMEGWDRRDNHVYTAVDGISDRWARAPYQPPYASERFQPFFYFSIYEVDNERFPQSVSMREAKLQDEYSATRSAGREARQRSIPGTLVNAAAMAPEELTKVVNSSSHEIIAVRMTDPAADVGKAFADKPIPRVDPRLYDTTPIKQDMDLTAGIQEAQQQATTVDKTATEAEIQQSGFMTRTNAARDMIESVLTDMANFTAQVAVQCITPEVAARIAGKTNYWPYGMAIEDILTMVEVDITAGTTGKPRNRGDREAWGVVMPLIAAEQAQLAQLQMMPGNEGLVTAKKELLRETMRRMGDDTDVDRFLPKPPLPLMVPGMPGAAPVPGAPQPAGAPSLPDPAAAGGALPGTSAPQPIPSSGVADA